MGRRWHPWDKVMQALSHFTYHISGGEFVLCDLQGGLSSDGAIITDPVGRCRLTPGFRN